MFSKALCIMFCINCCFQVICRLFLQSISHLTPKSAWKFYFFVNFLLHEAKVTHLMGLKKELQPLNDSYVKLQMTIK